MRRRVPTSGSGRSETEGVRRVDGIGDFFGALPDVAVAFWEFGDGFRGVLTLLVSVALGGALTYGALRLRDTSGWLSAILGTMAMTVALWWLFGILPSAWVYFADANRDLLAGTVIPSALPGLGNFYQVFRDTVVVVETGVAIGLVVVAALWIQKRYPRELAEGEEARPQSGGYK